MPSEAFETTREAMQPEVWNRAARALLAKTLAELAYEQVLSPVETAAGRYEITLSPALSYRFGARCFMLDHLVIDPATIERVEGVEAAPASDPLRLVADLAPVLEIAPFTAAHFTRELANTLLSDAMIAASATLNAQELSELDDIRMDGETTGHPWVTVSKGRIGFSQSDLLRHAPESRTSTRLDWIGVSRERAAFCGAKDMTPRQATYLALGEPAANQLWSQLEHAGRRCEDFLLMPVHAWQWDHFIVPQFASDIAAGHIVPVGRPDDLYLPQQSIRTFTNISEPARASLKLTLSIFNTAVYRGIPGKRALNAAPFSDWLDQLLRADSFLDDECRLVLLGERAGIHYQHPHFSCLPGAPYQFNEMLGAIWRDPLALHLEAGESGMPFSGLLHQGVDGKPVVMALVERSGLSMEDWLARFFDAVLPPLLHMMCKHGLGFSAHGQNATLILKNGIPARLALRDFIDDVNRIDADIPELETLPAPLRDLLIRLPPAYLIHMIQTTLFVCVFRYLAVLLATGAGYPEQRFWQGVARSIRAYQARFPELVERFSAFDFFTSHIPRVCLNRVRLFTHGYADDAERPVPAVAGELSNPLMTEPLA